MNDERSVMKKKRLLVILIVIVVLMLMLKGCGGSSSNVKSDTKETVTEEAVESGSAEASDSETSAAESDASDSESGTSDTGDSSDSGAGLLSPEFKKTMDDYEAWFDHYCEVMKSYKENPSDLELISEMTDLLTEETAMLGQMENMDQSEMNNAELAYYIEVTARIEKKLLEVAY